MATALLSLGANTPNKREAITNAIKAIGQIASITAQTPIYETPAEGSIVAQPYANALLLITTAGEYATLRETFKNWEKETGRTPQSKLQGIVPLDIDIIKWNDTLLKERDMEYEYMKKGLQLLDNTHC